ncbi:MAG: hypothetical protein IJF64_03270, partial [Clostridia bacterium]|nr:hypothetical protein [Clostridia bacterium]
LCAKQLPQHRFELAGGGRNGRKTSVWTYIWNTSVWVLVVAGVVVAFKLVKQKSIMQIGALVLTVAICATQLMNFTVASITTKGAYDSAIDRVYGKYENNPRFLTNKDIEKVGEKRNVVVFCIDRFDSVQYAEPAMKKYAEAFSVLDGFTYYEDSISMYGNTFPAVGYMMSGIEYGNDDRELYFNQVYHENQTISVLKEQGYNIHLYSEAYYDYTNANELPDYVENTVETTKDQLKTEVRKPWNFGFAITKMSLYRSFPFLLKDTVGKINSDTCNEYILYTSDELQGYKAFSYDLRNAYYDLKARDGEFQTKGEKNFSFIHVSGCHSADYDKNWKKTGKKDFLVSAKNSMELVGLYIQNMKAVSPDLYRDSTIVIMGDHGKVENRTKKFKKAMLTALFVKPSGVAGTPLKTSNAPVSHENLWATIFESEGISYSKESWKPSVFTVEKEFKATGVYPERKFIWNRRNSNLASYDSIVYKIKGDARDFDNWSIAETTFYDHPLFAN